MKTHRQHADAVDQAADVTASPGGDLRDAALSKQRSMGAKFRRILGPLGDTT